jgi:uridine phosphorylase
MGLAVLRADDGASPAGGRPGSLAGGMGVLAGSPPTSQASYPNFAGKHAEEAMFTPADFAAYLRRAGALDSYQPPAGVVLCYQRSLYHHVLQAEGLKPPARQGALHGLLLLPSTGGRVGLLGQFGIGAPAAAAALEELAAMGTGAFVSVGTAGSLQRDLNIGDLVLCEAAIRDEGVSHHYLPPGKLATAQAGMTAALEAALRQAGVPFRTGSSWTIDTPYRETVAEARRYQAEGVLCVEMEAAALFAVAEVRGLQVSSAFSISDSLADLVWNPQFHGPQVQAGLVRLYQAAVSALQAGTPDTGTSCV